MVLTEADTCRTFVVPKLQAAGWDTPPHTINEQRTFTDGRIFFVGRTARRGRQKRADYLLRYRPDFPIAVVEAKARGNTGSTACRGRFSKLRHYGEVWGKMWRLCCRRCCVPLCNQFSHNDPGAN